MASFNAIFTISLKWSILMISIIHLFMFILFSFQHVNHSVAAFLEILVCSLQLCFCTFLFCVPSCFVWLSFPAVDCGQPQPLRNGSITGGSTVYPNVMHFNCDEGFILRGASEIKCQTNGTWSKTSSLCDGKQ